MPKETRKEILSHLKRVVIKIGSGVISDHESGKPPLERGLSRKRIQGYARRIAKIHKTGVEVMIVSSGAVMAGRERLNLNRVKLDIPEKQASAAIGQSFLMRTYEHYFEKQGLKVAQILLGHHDLEHRQRFLNAKHTLEALLSHGVIPIINENDTVTVDEIKIGDNDTLSATMACLAGAQLLIILSDVEGLYTDDPRKTLKKNEAAPELISLVRSITPDIEKRAGKSKNPLSRGGMYTKVQAAKKTMSYGVPTLIVNGLDSKVLDQVFKGHEVGTLFWAGPKKVSPRKHWIAHTLKPLGAVTIDAGARRALVNNGKSLLPAGVTQVEGKFEFGSPVRILDDQGVEVARGLVNYNSADLARIKGLTSAKIRDMLETGFYEEAIHRDDLVILEPAPAT
ncbi:MAG: glutamate 5-kinase [Nitrospina sp.]|nr:glutamate 5-kinase [Nitrospina sp.]